MDDPNMNAYEESLSKPAITPALEQLKALVERWRRSATGFPLHRYADELAAIIPQIEREMQELDQRSFRRGSESMLISIRASLRDFPNRGGDIEISKAVNRCIQAAGDIAREEGRKQGFREGMNAPHVQVVSDSEHRVVLCRNCGEAVVFEMGNLKKLIDEAEKRGIELGRRGIRPMARPTRPGAR